MKIAVLYGTETGNAEMLAEDMAGELEGDHDVTCANLSGFDPAGFDPAIFYILVSSTYGDGDLPASAQPFAKAMEAKAPDLSGIHFAVFGLGDSEYHETFNGGGEKLAALMALRGAVQVGERVTHDASGPDMAEDLALPWARAVIETAASLVGEDA